MNMTYCVRRIVLGAIAALTCAGESSPALSAAPTGGSSRQGTATPIEHLIVIVGENQTFDGVFATYTSKTGASVRNLLSQGIITANGEPGPRFSLATQYKALPQPHYALDLQRSGPYASLPQPRLTGVLDQKFHDVGRDVDARFPDNLPPGPFPISRYVPYPGPTSAPTLESATAALSASTGDPVHRFFQMWQQTGGDNSRLDLYTWVAVTTGMGADTAGITARDTGQGGEVMGFANVQQGDTGLLRDLADRYALSDNYHQSIMGGTGANFFTLTTGDLPVYEIDGAVATPPANQIENPDPAAGTDNFYRQDGYQGGSYVNCSDPGQPGVAPILEILRRAGVPSHCEPGRYYLVNNYGAGYDLDGHPQPLGPHNQNYPPQRIPTIAAALSSHGVSWKWYSGGRDPEDVTSEMRTLHLSLEAARRLQYNDIGDPLVASVAVMTQPNLRSKLAGLNTFNNDVRRGTVPAVSFLVPKNLDSGHPGNSVLANYEDFVRSVITTVESQPKLWAHTAILITTDEGGGHFDSGYIQTVDFFGDGPRIPLLAVSPYARRGHVDHVYHDHASILKFIEHNWHLPPLSARSRDNLPNPIAAAADPYRPTNAPAVGDLMSLFDFQPAH
jgi:phospholipase C